MLVFLLYYLAVIFRVQRNAFVQFKGYGFFKAWTCFHKCFRKVVSVVLLLIRRH